MVVKNPIGRAERLSMFLGSRDYSAKLVASGEEALQTAATWHPSLVLVDAALPDMDTGTFTKRVRQINGFEHLPVIITTKKLLADHVAEARSDEIDDIIQTPAHREEMVLRIESALEGRRKTESLEQWNLKLSTELKNYSAAETPGQKDPLEKDDVRLKPRIFVASSEADLRDRVVAMLEDSGYETEFGEGSVEAFGQIEHWLPDVVLLDIDTPDEAGFDVLEQLRDSSTLSSTAVILFATEISNELRISALAGGAVDIISKPVDGLELMMKLQSILTIKHYGEELKQVNERLAREKGILAKYFSLNFIESLLSGEISTDLGGDNVNATILFFDLRNSTGIAESIPPEKFSELISLLFTDIMDLVQGYGGSVNKMLGDGIMATFGCPFSQGDDAFNAVRCASAMREYLETFNTIRPQYLEEPVSAGIGISSGKVFAGNVGSVIRMEYTVLGDPVNLASRLESLTKLAKKDILIDGPTLELVADRVEVEREHFDQIRGKLQEVEIFSVNDLKKEETQFYSFD